MSRRQPAVRVYVLEIAREMLLICSGLVRFSCQSLLPVSCSDHQLLLGSTLVPFENICRTDLLAKWNTVWSALFLQKCMIPFTPTLVTGKHVHAFSGCIKAGLAARRDPRNMQALHMDHEGPPEALQVAYFEQSKNAKDPEPSDSY